MVRGADITFQEIFNNMMDASQNLEVKTEVHSPDAYGAHNALIDFHLRKGRTGIAKIMKGYQEFIMKVFISYMRKGRKEVFESTRDFIFKAENLKSAKGLDKVIKRI